MKKKSGSTTRLPSPSGKRTVSKGRTVRTLRPNQFQAQSGLGSGPAIQSIYKTVQTTRLYEQIVQQIEESVLKGLLKPGDQLPAERDLAQLFGVSRTAVREAVKALREKNLVEAQPGRGTFITGGTRQTMRQSFGLMLRAGDAEGAHQLSEVRAIFEPEIAALAATRVGDSDLAMMREAIATMDRSLDDPEGFIEGDLDFHLALAEAADNPIILTLIDSIVGLLREHRLDIFGVEGGPERGQYHHKRILEAVERRDADAARQAMRSHLQQVRRDFLSSAKLKRPGGPIRHG